MDFSRVIDEVAGFMRREDVRFALAGAFALHAYGLSRATADLDFVTDAKTYDRIGIAEGKFVSLTVDERDATSELGVGDVLWIIDGKSDDS